MTCFSGIDLNPSAWVICATRRLRSIAIPNALRLARSHWRNVCSSKSARSSAHCRDERDPQGDPFQAGQGPTPVSSLGARAVGQRRALDRSDTVALREQPIQRVRRMPVLAADRARSAERAKGARRGFEIPGAPTGQARRGRLVDFALASRVASTGAPRGSYFNPTHTTFSEVHRYVGHPPRE